MYMIDSMANSQTKMFETMMVQHTKMISKVLEMRKGSSSSSSSSSNSRVRYLKNQIKGLKKEIKTLKNSSRH